MSMMHAVVVFGHPGSDKAPELNLYGVQALGLGLGTLMHELVPCRPISSPAMISAAIPLSVKQALEVGLMQAGITVHDIGLALSRPWPTSPSSIWMYPLFAMVTASHNSNGWTGVKMGVERPLTFGPDEMSRLKTIVLDGLGKARTKAVGYVREHGGVRRALYRRSCWGFPRHPQAEGGCRLRQWHGGRVCTGRA